MTAHQVSGYNPGTPSIEATELSQQVETISTSNLGHNSQSPSHIGTGGAVTASTPWPASAQEEHHIAGGELTGKRPPGATTTHHEHDLPEPVSAFDSDSDDDEPQAIIRLSENEKLQKFLREGPPRGSRQSSRSLSGLKVVQDAKLKAKRSFSFLRKGTLGGANEQPDVPPVPELPPFNFGQPLGSSPPIEPSAHEHPFFNQKLHNERSKTSGRSSTFTNLQVRARSYTHTVRRLFSSERSQLAAPEQNDLFGADTRHADMERAMHLTHEPCPWAGYDEDMDQGLEEARQLAESSRQERERQELNEIRQEEAKRQKQRLTEQREQRDQWEKVATSHTTAWPFSIPNPAGQQDDFEQLRRESHSFSHTVRPGQISTRFPRTHITGDQELDTESYPLTHGHDFSSDFYSQSQASATRQGMHNSGYSIAPNSNHLDNTASLFAPRGNSWAQDEVARLQSAQDPQGSVDNPTSSISPYSLGIARTRLHEDHSNYEAIQFSKTPNEVELQPIRPEECVMQTPPRRLHQGDSRLYRHAVRRESSSEHDTQMNHDNTRVHGVWEHSIHVGHTLLPFESAPIVPEMPSIEPENEGRPF